MYPWVVDMLWPMRNEVNCKCITKNPHQGIALDHEATVALARTDRKLIQIAACEQEMRNPPLAWLSELKWDLFSQTKAIPGVVDKASFHSINLSRRELIFYYPTCMLPNPCKRGASWGGLSTRRILLANYPKGGSWNNRLPKLTLPKGGLHGCRICGDFSIVEPNFELLSLRFSNHLVFLVCKHFSMQQRIYLGNQRLSFSRVSFFEICQFGSKLHLGALENTCKRSAVGRR